jgi:hypothetical protein
MVKEQDMWRKEENKIGASKNYNNIKFFLLVFIGSILIISFLQSKSELFEDFSNLSNKTAESKFTALNPVEPLNEEFSLGPNPPVILPEQYKDNPPHSVEKSAPPSQTVILDKAENFEREDYIKFLENAQALIIALLEGKLEISYLEEFNKINHPEKIKTLIEKLWQENINSSYQKEKKTDTFYQKIASELFRISYISANNNPILRKKMIEKCRILHNYLYSSEFKKNFTKN